MSTRKQKTHAPASGDRRPSWIVRDLHAADRAQMRQILKENRGRIGNGKTRAGRRVPFQGQTWIIADLDADSNATQGVLLLLLRSDYKKLARFVDLQDLEGIET